MLQITTNIVVLNTLIAISGDSYDPSSGSEGLHLLALPDSAELPAQVAPEPADPVLLEEAGEAVPEGLRDPLRAPLRHPAVRREEGVALPPHLDLEALQGVPSGPRAPHLAPDLLGAVA